MPVEAFEHVNLRTTDLERAREFYERIVGLRVGDRPPFESKGYWLYLGSQPIVHLSLRKSGEAAQSGSGNFDHLAFRAVDLDATRATIRDAGLSFREAVVPRDGTIQIFVRDPDGIQVELNFHEDLRI